MGTKIKICCISSEEEAQIATRLGADVLGLVGHMPSGPGIIGDDLIHEIAQTIDPPTNTFLLTSETTAQGIISHHQKVGTTAIQLVDSLDITTYKVLRENLPGIDLVQVVHVVDENNIAEAIEVSKFVDYILLDSGNPNLAIKELGGTGRTHNWELSKKIRKSIDIPLFLAGGLHAGNVRQAIDQVQPYGVDLCSGVRTDGHLDEAKLKAFIQSVRS